MKSSLLYRRIFISVALILSILAVNSARPLLALSGINTVKEAKISQTKKDKQETNEEILASVHVEAVIPFLKIDLNNDLLAELKPIFFEVKERRFYRSFTLSTTRYFKNLFTYCIAINAP